MAEPSYAPRTVAIVALSSLVVGFLVVFGGGMALLRPQGHAVTAVADEPEAPARPASRADASTAVEPPGTDSATAVADEADAGGASPTAPSAPAPEPVQVAGISLGAASTSRCFDQGNPASIAGAQCDRLTGLDQWVQSKAAEIATCARAGQHGHLALVLDFRFSTSFVRGWGSPTSNIPNPGNVSACVKQKITPLPFAQIQHAHDRYLVVLPIDW